MQFKGEVDESISNIDKFFGKRGDGENLQAGSRKVGIPVEERMSEVEVELHLVSTVRPGARLTPVTTDPYRLLPCLHIKGTL